jgi:hypothetical protein
MVYAGQKEIPQKTKVGTISFKAASVMPALPEESVLDSRTGWLALPHVRVHRVFWYRGHE